MKIKTLFFCFILLSPVCLIGQNINVDSLINVLETQTQLLTAREQFDINGQIREVYRSRDVDKFIQYAKQGLSIAEKESDKKSRYKMYDIAYDELGIGYTFLGQYDTAQIYFEKALEYATKIKDKLIYRIYLRYSVFYFNQCRYDTALEYLFKALPLCREDENKEIEVAILNNISSVYCSLGDFGRAKDYAEQQKNIVEEYKLENQRVLVYDGLGAIYYNLKEYDKALEYRMQVEKICEELNDKRISINNNLGLYVIYSNGFKDYDKAGKYIEEAVKIADEFGDPHSIFYCLSHLAEFYIYI